MAITIVQAQPATGTSPLTVSLTATAGATTLIVAMGASTPTFASSVVTSGSQSLGALSQTANSGNCSAEIWYLDAISSGQTSLVVTNTGGPGHLGVVVLEVAGLATTSGDKHTGTSHTSTNPISWTSGSTGTLSQPNELIVGATGCSGLISSSTGPGAPWTNLNPLAYMIAGYDIVAATTALSYAGSSACSGTSNTATSIASFKQLITAASPVGKRYGPGQAVMRSALW